MPPGKTSQALTICLRLSNLSTRLFLALAPLFFGFFQDSVTTPFSLEFLRIPKPERKRVRASRLCINSTRFVLGSTKLPMSSANTFAGSSNSIYKMFLFETPRAEP
jgi:hypothetical protein